MPKGNPWVDMTESDYIDPQLIKDMRQYMRARERNEMIGAVSDADAYRNVPIAPQRQIDLTPGKPIDTSKERLWGPGYDYFAEQERRAKRGY